MMDAREYRAAAAGATVVLGYAALILVSGRVSILAFSNLLAAYIGISFAIWLMVGGLCTLAMLHFDGRQGGERRTLGRLVQAAVHQRWQRDRLVSLLWPPLLFATLLASFNAFKQMILPLAGFGWDPILAEADRALFFGTDPWRITHAVLGSPQATLLIDRAYHGWFVPMSLGLIACAWMPGSTFRLRTQYMLSYIAVWIVIGSILAFLMPSAGPCFYEHYVGGNTGFHELLQRMTATEAATGERLTSLGNQAMLMKMHGTDTLTIGGGISAMPSVHNALAALFALAAFQLNRTAGWLVAIYAAAIWIGSIHLGWHYALDGVVGVAMTLGIWIVCGRIAALLDGESQASEAAAAFA